MRAGPLNKWGDLANSPTEPGDDDGFYAPLNPARVPMAIESVAPGNSDGRVSMHIVRMRYHPGVTLETRITVGTKQLFVKGIQDVNQQGVEMRLFCEEVL